MTGRSEAFELRQQLRDAIAAQLAPAGWTPVTGRADDSMALAAFLRPLKGDFGATVEYHRAFSTPDRPPVQISQPLFGVAYEPLRRLWPLLDDHEHLAALVEWPQDMPEEARMCRMEVETDAEVKPVAAQLAGLALAHASEFAERYTSVDAILEAHRDRHEETDGLDRVVPALLAAAGRLDDARSALARYRREADSPEECRRERRFVYQLTRWIDSGGDLSLLPSEPPPQRHDRPERRPMADRWREIRARHKAVEEAVTTVTAAGDGHSRSERRAMLESELARRGVSENPLWFEERLDQLDSTRAERARQGASALKTLGKFGLFVAKALRDHELPELPDISVPDCSNRLLRPSTRCRGVASQVASGPRSASRTESKSGSRESMPRYHV